MVSENDLFEAEIDPRNKKEAFIFATIRCLGDHGYHGTTVRQIAKYAKVAPGLLTHYFEGKEVLIAETYKYLSDYFLDSFHERANREKDDPIAALQVFLSATFQGENLNPKLLKVWLAFWSFTLTHENMRNIHRENYRSYIKAIEDMLTRAYEASGKDINPRSIHSIAIGINSLLDGLWLEWSLDPSTFSTDEGLEIVYQFVEKTTGLTLT